MDQVGNLLLVVGGCGLRNQEVVDVVVLEEEVIWSYLVMRLERISCTSCR
jgi:hypothetical protein